MDIKELLGTESAALIEDGMVVGLGTGTTATAFIESLSERCRGGLRITAVATSEATADLARSLGITLVSIEDVDNIDIVVDGADEVDDNKRIIKGGGGALLREKIVATMSKRVVIIVEEDKRVENLGAFGLPVEIVPFGYKATIEKLVSLGYSAELRNDNGEAFVTDGGNYIVDITLDEPLRSPEDDNIKIISVVGVIETGFFFGIADAILVGYHDGHTEII
ncbi:MAG: ribose 5-phosphate isomerase A [Waddliaceae bacterium]|nr:ribose 5-phosphate isomerase A [Waddliaceae bacterium]